MGTCGSPNGCAERICESWSSSLTTKPTAVNVFWVIFDAKGTARFEGCPGGYRGDLPIFEEDKMKKKKLTAGQRMIASARQALAFARGERDNGRTVHIPDSIDVKAIREKISLSQGEFAQLFGLSKRTLEHWEHGRRVPSGPAKAFLTVIAREPDAVRRALLHQD
jgi:putative transcriptional regulator